MRKARITRADISDAQQTAARLFVLHPDWTKEQVAEGAGVSRTALYGWLRDSRFTDLIEKYQSDQRLPLTSPDDIVEQLDEEARLELLSQLEAAEHEQPKKFEKMNLEVGRLERRLKSASDCRRNKIESAIDKLVGRLKIISCPNERDFYNDDGSLKPVSARNFQRLGEDLEEDAIYSRVLGKSDFEEVMLQARYAYAIAALLKHGLPIDNLMDTATSV